MCQPVKLYCCPPAQRDLRDWNLANPWDDRPATLVFRGSPTTDERKLVFESQVRWFPAHEWHTSNSSVLRPPALLLLLLLLLLLPPQDRSSIHGMALHCTCMRLRRPGFWVDLWLYVYSQVLRDNEFADVIAVGGDPARAVKDS